MKKFFKSKEFAVLTFFLVFLVSYALAVFYWVDRFEAAGGLHGIAVTIGKEIKQISKEIEEK